MMTFISGPPASGKSAFAESLVIKSSYKKRYYIATMEVVDDESEKRRDKHREVRFGKGFVTLEIPHHIDRSLDHMDDPKQSVVLLECVANLVGNVMHSDEIVDDIPAYVAQLVKDLEGHVGELIVVSEDYSHDPKASSYDHETAEYIRLLHDTNEKLKECSDSVYER